MFHSGVSNMVGRRHAAYFRVSTQRQGASGLGLDAQRAAVRAYLGDSWPPIAEFTEIESGRRNDRPRLAEALAFCKAGNSILCIANLSRLARNVAFIANLMESGVEFVCADMPSVNRLTIHVLAAVAEEEARLISSRTKLALVQWRERNPGKRLGSPVGFQIGTSTLGNAVKMRAADERAAKIGPTVMALRRGGMKLAEIGARLTEMGIAAPRGGMWTATQVSRVLRRTAEGAHLPSPAVAQQQTDRRSGRTGDGCR
jgi:DNA invertase Pin-like site-specific DNA recombinase